MIVLLDRNFAAKALLEAIDETGAEFVAGRPTRRCAAGV
jgi:hypothetical protein